MRRGNTAVNQGRLMKVYNWLNYARRVLFPPVCRLCLAPCTGTLPLCPPCRDELPWLGVTCNRCALPLPLDYDQHTCPACLSHPPSLDSCRALFSYQPPLDDWIHALKFGRDLAVAHLLGQLLVEHLPSPEAGTRVLAVPLHPRRLRQRGYNQATQIARPLIQRGWLPDGCGCYRARHTPAQSALPATDRRGNLRGAFGVRKQLEGENILLIDDVMTTGTTLNEVATVLKDAGAGRVDARVIARALRPA